VIAAFILVIKKANELQKNVSYWVVIIMCRFANSILLNA